MQWICFEKRRKYKPKKAGSTSSDGPSAVSIRPPSSEPVSTAVLIRPNDTLNPEGLTMDEFWRADRFVHIEVCLLYTSPSPRDGLLSRMPSSA